MTVNEQDIDFMMFIRSEPTQADQAAVKAKLNAICERKRIVTKSVEDIGDATIVVFKTADDADLCAEELLKCGCIPGADANGGKLSFHIGLSVGPSDQKDRIKNSRNAEALSKNAEHNQVVISTSVYQKLSAAAQQYYKPSEKIGPIDGHRRYARDLRVCFVISPIGPENSAVRRDADRVYNNYIQRACNYAGYRPVRGDLMSGSHIGDEVASALAAEPMVIAYLGDGTPGWNPNVMYEIGQRQANGLPMVLLQAKTTNGDKTALPFDIAQERVIEVPSEQEEATMNVDRRSQIVQTIFSRIEKESETPDLEQWRYPLAYGTIVIEGNNGKNTRFIDASGELMDLFGKDVKLKPLKEVIDSIANQMNQNQRAKFMDEQAEILGRIYSDACDVFSQDSNRLLQKLTPTVPIIFDDHENSKYVGRAYLPFIVRFKKDKLLRLTVIYIEVTSAVRKVIERGVEFYCCKWNDQVQLPELQ